MKPRDDIPPVPPPDQPSGEPLDQHGVATRRDLIGPRRPFVRPGIFNRLCRRIVLALIGPAIQQELLRHQRDEDLAFDDRVAQMVNRYRVTGWDQGDALAKRQRFWKILSEELANVRAAQDVARAHSTASQTRVQPLPKTQKRRRS